MQLVRDYLQLYKSFPGIQQGRAFNVTMSELAGILFCSTRNVKIILRKMIERKWIHFIPGLGRGNASSLTFLLDYEAALKQESEELVKSGQIEAAFQLIKTFGEGSAYNRERFLEWLSQYFGYYVDDRHNAYFETLRLPIFREINTLDPAETFYGFDSHMIDQIFNTLVEYDYETKIIQGSIAHHWKVDESATLWTFHLRKGVLFHHGRELVADDVKFSLKRLADPLYDQNWLVKDIDDIEILSRYSLQIRLKRPNYLFLRFLSYPPTSIVPHEIYEHYRDTDYVIPIGSGAYRVTKRSSEMCVIEAFDHYFKGRPFIDRIEVIVIPETNELLIKPSSNLLFIQTGENNDNNHQPTSEWEEDLLVTGCTVLTLNIKKYGALTDKNFRKALHHFVNRQSMVTDLGQSRVYPASSFVLNNRPQSFDTDWNREEALNYLNASSYGGEVIRLFTYKRHAPDAYWLQEEYAKYGINIEVVIVPWKDMLLKENIENADFILFEIVLSEGIIRLIENYQSFFIRSHLSEKLSTLVENNLADLFAQSIEELQNKCLKNIEECMKEEHALIFLVYKCVSSTSHSSLQDVKVSPRGWVDFKKIWFE
jgi:SgrR family transcriptional regulator